MLDMSVWTTVGGPVSHWCVVHAVVVDTLTVAQAAARHT
jgi:hypothetical protein